MDVHKCRNCRVWDSGGEVVCYGETLWQRISTNRIMFRAIYQCLQRLRLGRAAARRCSESRWKHDILPWKTPELLFVSRTIYRLRERWCRWSARWRPWWDWSPRRLKTGRVGSTQERRSLMSVVSFAAFVDRSGSINKLWTYHCWLWTLFSTIIVSFVISFDEYGDCAIFGNYLLFLLTLAAIIIKTHPCPRMHVVILFQSKKKIPSRDTSQYFYVLQCLLISERILL